MKKTALHNMTWFFSFLAVLIMGFMTLPMMVSAVEPKPVITADSTDTVAIADLASWTPAARRTPPQASS